MIPLGTRSTHWVIIGAFLFIIFGYQLGTRGLNEPDEGRYANIALEALENDHPWWEPQLADIGHYDKPPLTYWISALGYRVFGVNEWGARLPSLVGGCLTLLGLGWLAFRRYGPQVAWLSVLVGGTTLQIWLWSRILSSDMLLTGFCTVAIAAWAETRHRGGSWAWWCLQAIFWALAGWTKATPALVPMLGLSLFVYLAGDAEDRRALRLPWLLPLVILLSIPWFVIVIACHPDLQSFFLHRELVQRITGHIAGRAGPLYYYLPLCLLGWLPWWPLAAIAGIRQRAQLHLGSGRWKETLGPGAFLVMTGFCIFSLIGSKHATYLLPFAPWAALEMGRTIHRDRTLRQSSVILSVGVLAASVYLAGVSMVPSRESHWGMHSSLRTVAAALRQNHATGIYSDHFWPSLEVYWGEKVYFADPAPEEITDKVDEPAEHFGFGKPMPILRDWFVHFRKQADSPYQHWLDDPRVPKIYVGDFVIGPMTSTHGLKASAGLEPSWRSASALGYEESTRKIYGDLLLQVFTQGDLSE